MCLVTSNKMTMEEVEGGGGYSLCCNLNGVILCMIGSRGGGRVQAFEC